MREVVGSRFEWVPGARCAASAIGVLMFWDGVLDSLGPH